MKKRDEGYALAFVLVVVVVICLVAVSMMTVSLRNLEAQTASVERMKDKYEAQGIVEQIVSSIDSGFVCSIVVGEDADDTIKKYLIDLNTEYITGAEAFIGSTSGDTENLTAKLTLKVQPTGSAVQINTVVGYVANIEEDTVNNKYIVTNPNVTYISHEVVSTGGGA